MLPPELGQDMQHQLSIGFSALRLLRLLSVLRGACWQFLGGRIATARACWPSASSPPHQNTTPLRRRQACTMAPRAQRPCWRGGRTTPTSASTSPPTGGASRRLVGGRRRRPLFGRRSCRAEAPPAAGLVLICKWHLVVTNLGSRCLASSRPVRGRLATAAAACTSARHRRPATLPRCRAHPCAAPPFPCRM